MKRLNGIFLSHRKHTEDQPTQRPPLPKEVRIPMSMHMGAPCTPLVAVGDAVTVGQRIGEAPVPFSVPIHASVSGTVTAIQDYLCANGTTCPCIVIAADGEQTVCPDLTPPTITNRDELVAAAKASGCVGLGGAGFPTHIKLNPKTPVDMLVVNGAECEPFLTSDCRQMIEDAEAVFGGIRLIMQALQIPSCRIGIETNKPVAIQNLVTLCEKTPEIQVVPLPALYPQGAEKVLIYHTTGRVVMEGTLPSDAGVIVMNVSTCAFLYHYQQTGMPLVERRLTIDGDAVSKPCNVIVPIGTSMRSLLEFAGCDFEHLKRLIGGGPMMGLSLYTPDTPVCKPNNGLLAFQSDAKIRKTTACIRCGRCVKACPMKLMPTELERAYHRKDVDALRTQKLMLCMNCGCCSFVCPAGRPLAESNQLAKSLIPRK